MMTRSLPICLVLLAISASAVLPKNGPAFFENRIRPILIERCYECHSEKADKQKGGLWLDRRAGWLEGGESGPAVVPHNLTKSLLPGAITRKDADTAMPPDDPLSEEEVALLLRWIKIGAPGPRKENVGDFVRLGDQEALSKKAKTHWSFQPIQKPSVADDNSIDRLLRRKLPKAIRIAPTADKRSLIRRLYYDLTGLPPSIEAVDGFANSANSKAWENLVDELLASPRFGERWGRYWLDIARYADTREWQAAGRDSRYPFAFTYRDYVIRSFNADKPYDVFIREQIAADSYVDDDDAPELAALGFLTVGSRYRNNRDEIHNDRIDVVTRGIMGLTVSCARCHDHKYDPIPTTDYYALKGVFASCADPAEYPTISAYEQVAGEAANYAKAYAKAEKALNDYTHGLATAAMADFRKKPDAYLGALHDIYVSKTDNVRKLITGGKFKETALTPLARTLPRLVSAKSYRQHAVWRPWSLLMGKPNAEFAKALQAHLAGKDAITIPLVLDELKRQPVPKNRKAFMFRYGQILAKGLGAKNPEILKAFDEPQSPIFISDDAATRASGLLGKGRTTLARYKGTLIDLDAEHPGAPARAMVLNDIKRPIDVPVFERGDSNRKGEIVPRRFLQVLGGQGLNEGSGRRQLAEAITAPDNPFPARVHANRVWSHLFGQSLVDTPGDFGLQAPVPLHLDLLNWLADSLMKEAWSTKNLVRKIVLSKTYQASSDVDGDPDPENRYLARANVRRLDFEAMRDSILAASGALDLREGGRAVDITVAPYPPRRTVYAYVDRVNMDDMFSTFDFPSPDVSSPERSLTMVPQQALFSLNDPFTILQARALTASLDKQGFNKANEKLNWLYQRVFQRAPKPVEIKLSLGFLARAVQAGGPPRRAWSYGIGPAEPQLPAAKRFSPFPYFDAGKQAYQLSKAMPHPARGFVRLNAKGGNPGPRDAAIRRWTAPVAGNFRIAAHLTRASEKGDTIRARVIGPRGSVLGEWVVKTGEIQTPVDRITVQKGDTVDFIVDANENAANDTFDWTVTISQIGDYETMPSGEKRVWDSQADFSRPPPRQLRPWEQMAHALLMTNEFLFVD
jgi:hypothetical protein